MKGYESYVEDVKSGKIVTGELIKLAVKRFETFKNREDIYFDEEEVDRCIRFFSKMKHFKGKMANTPFVLLPWQQFLIANIFGLKWKETNNRVCRELYLQVARKAGKDTMAAAIMLYLLVADGEASPEVVLAANTTDQAKIAFEYVDMFAKSIDPSEKVIQHYRNYVKMPKNNGIVQVISSDASKMDGKNCSAFILDEYHEAKDRKMYDVLRSSQGMREAPLAMIITTAGYNLESPCHDMYTLGIEVLNDVKQMDNFFPFIFQMDEDDDWTDEKSWYKCQPNLGTTVSIEYMREEINKAKIDKTSLVGVKTKNLNMWLQSIDVWIPQEVVVKCMQPVDLEDFRGQNCVIGMDLGSVSDFTSITVMIPDTENDIFYFKSYTFIPEATYKDHPNRELYKKFVQEGSMIVTCGNICDYAYVENKIREINDIVWVEKVWTDNWNATQVMIDLQNMGFVVEPFSQAIGNYNNTTKEMERRVREKKCVIDKCSNVLWQFGNVSLRLDQNGNTKPDKGKNSKKIDSIISMCTAQGGYIKENMNYDLEIFKIC